MNPHPYPKCQPQSSKNSILFKRLLQLSVASSRGVTIDNLLVGCNNIMLKGSSLLPDTQTSDPEQQFQLLDILGQGAYGSVSKALHKKTGNLYAIKILSATSLSEINAIKKEIQILKLCDNQHIVKYFGSYFKDNNLWIVLEYCHAGSIIDLINITQKRLNQNEIASILQSVLEGLIYLHSNKKIHRDIKAANILLNSQGIAKLADFGVSTESMYTNAGHRSQVGSPYWMSPEVMKHNEYTNKTDIWSLGVTAIELAEGVVPNSHLKPLIAMWQLKDKPIQGFKDNQKWSAEFNSFVRECLNINPMLRPQAKTLLKHDFIVNNSRGQRLLAQLVQHSLQDIEQFRKGEEHSQDSQNDLMNMLNGSGFGTKTIVNNKTERSRQSHDLAERQILREIDSQCNGSMIINDNEGSMIINQDGSMVVNDEPQKPSAFLNKYISQLKSNVNQAEQYKQQLRKKISDYDERCLNELEAVFTKHKELISGLMVDGGDRFFGIDMAGVREELSCKLEKSENIKEFLLSFPKYKQKQVKEVKQFERTNLYKKKSQFSEMAHHSTQTNDPGYTDLAQFKDGYPRGVKSQEFNEKQFKTNQKHCFNSKSIISDMENVKYTGDEGRGRNQRSNKRFIVTQPYQWTSTNHKHFIPSQNTSISDKSKLKQFLLDPDVKQSLMNHIQHFGRLERSPPPINTAKYDRIAESTLYHDCEDDTFKHQNSITITRGRDYMKYHEGQIDYLLPHEEFDEDGNQVKINLFNAKASGKNQKNDGKKKPKPQKRVASSQKRPAAKANPRKQNK